MIKLPLRRIFKTCTWQITGLVWFMSYAVITGGDLLYTLGLSLASIPAGAIMYFCHEWIWEKIK
tara:strand:- start:2293 stop:2484 length:192 start_codon:yes stop_codon:yes gene_type:complete